MIKLTESVQDPYVRALRDAAGLRVREEVIHTNCHITLSSSDKRSQELRFRTVKIIYDVYISKVCQLFQAIKPTLMTPRASYAPFTGPA